MKVLDRLLVEQSETRSAIAEILDCESISDDQQAELSRLTDKAKKLEVRHRAALLAEPEPEPVTAPAVPAVDAEEREKRELRRKSRVTNFLVAALDGHARLTGPEGEYAAAVGCEERAIPLDLFEEDEVVETRADVTSTTPNPAGFSFGNIVPKIFARSVAPRLGIQMPRVPSGAFSLPTLSTGLTAEAKAKGAAIESTAASFSVSTTTPHRISASFSIDEADRRSTSLSGWESAIRTNMAQTLSSTLDQAILTGDGSGATINGLMSRLEAVDAPTATVTWTSWVEQLAGYVDGMWAESLRDLRVLVPPRVYQKLSSTHSSTDQPVSAADWSMSHGVSLTTSSRMPALSSNIGDGIVFRAGAGVTPSSASSMPAVQPVWGNGLHISDVFSDSAKAVTHYRAHIWVGSVLVKQPGAYRRIRTKVS